MQPQRANSHECCELVHSTSPEKRRQSWRECLYGDCAACCRATAERDSEKGPEIYAILSSKSAITDIGILRSLASKFGDEKTRIRVLAHILMAYSHPELIEKERDPTATRSK
jgi:hypothetical protein